MPDTSAQSTAGTGLGRVNAWLLGLLACALPLSTSAVSVFAVLLILLGLIEGSWWRRRREILGHPLCAALACYLALHVLGLLWTSDLLGGCDVLEGMWKLLLLPLFFTMTGPEWRRRQLALFLLGMTAAALISSLVWADILHLPGVSPAHPTKRVFHVIYNPMLALAIFILLHELLWSEQRPARRAVGTLWLAFLSWNMFITEGRTGQVLFFILLIFALFLRFHRRWGRLLLTMALVLPLIFSCAYQVSGNFQRRIAQVHEELRVFGMCNNTSVGLRLVYFINSALLIGEHPLIGVGTGDFQQAYAAMNKRNSEDMPNTDNPHNQYLLTMVRLGLPGLAALLAMFWCQWRQGWSRRDPLWRLQLAFPLCFCCIMLADSYLTTYETGILWTFMGAVLYQRTEDEGQKAEGRGRGTGDSEVSCVAGERE
ncbi:MAG: hypothetical protein BWK76_26800 [Desulfobulbaceae bacterium A2]|nr:MAG: hypothetical protein BWK76_26800 [Desulfobulbaceae bacterium A2]